MSLESLHMEAIHLFLIFPWLECEHGRQALETNTGVVHYLLVKRVSVSILQKTMVKCLFSSVTLPWVGRLRLVLLARVQDNKDREAMVMNPLLQPDTYEWQAWEVPFCIPLATVTESMGFQLLQPVLRY